MKCISRETWTLFLALNNIHFLRVLGKSLRNNATSTILSSAPPWYAISQIELVARGNNEEKDKMWIVPLPSRTLYLNQSFPFYIFHTYHLVAESSSTLAFVSLYSNLIITTPARSQSTSLCIFVVNFEKMSYFFLALYCWNWGKC